MMRTTRIEKRWRSHGAPKVIVRCSPWRISNYYTKKKQRLTNDIGQMIESDESIAEPIGWNEQSKIQLKCNIMAEAEQFRRINMDNDALFQRVETLKKLIPDISDAFESMKMDVLSELVLNLDDISHRLLRIKSELPKTDVSKLVSRNIFLLREEWELVESNVLEMKEILHDFSEEDTARLLQQSPEVVNVDTLKEVLGGIKHFFPDGDAKSILLSNPDMALSMQGLGHLST